MVGCHEELACNLVRRSLLRRGNAREANFALWKRQQAATLQMVSGSSSVYAREVWQQECFQLLMWHCLACRKEAAMPIEKVTILDGTRADDKNLEPLLAVLKDELRRTGGEVQTFTLREIK